MQPKTTYVYSTGDFYRLYKKDTPKEEQVEFKKYKAFIKDFFIAVGDKIIKERWSFYFPYKLGFLTIKSHTRKNRSQPINWKSTNDLGRLIYHTNLHSFKRIFRFKWNKSRLRFRNRKFYRFHPEVALKHRLKDNIRKTSEDPEIKFIR